MAKSKDWIKGAIKRPGALKAKAKAAGKLDKDGDIKKSWIDKMAEDKGGNVSPRTQKQAQLAKTLGKMRSKKK